ncbi:MAG: hypothetical protein PVI79_04810 [Gammaproteobacteria bacterium]|jgi:hypothetical protein
MKLESLRGDLFGGATAAIVALPLALAFGVASGAGALAGQAGSKVTKGRHRFLRAALTTLLLGGAIATSAARAAAGWTDFVRVAELVPTSKHYYEVRLPVDNNPSGCREKTWFYQNYESPGAEQMFEVLLESLTSDIRLRVYVTGVCNLSGYAEFSSISVTR